jgi:hypothetical protein
MIAGARAVLCVLPAIRSNEPGEGFPSPPAAVASAPATGSPVVKILIGCAVFVVVAGALAAGGMYYVVYRVKQKVHEVAAEIPGGSPNSGGNSVSNSTSNSGGGSVSSGSNGGLSGDACRLLSKEEVGHAIGVEIVATQTAAGGCSYLAKGDSGSMTAKHISAMMGTKGADAKTQQMMQSISGGMFKAMQKENHEASSDSNGNVPVFTFSVDNNAAETQMQLNRKLLGGLGPGAQDIPGIGDQAFDHRWGFADVSQRRQANPDHVFHLPLFAGQHQAAGQRAGRSFVGNDFAK